MRNKNVGGEEAGTKGKGEMKKKNAAEKMVNEKTEPLYFKTRSASVIPAKRKSVKRMVCECIFESICDKCSKLGPPAASKSSKGASVHPSASEFAHDTDMAD